MSISINDKFNFIHVKRIVKYVYLGQLIIYSFITQIILI